MNLATKHIRKGRSAIIRAFADEHDGRKRCRTLEFVKEMGRQLPDELTKLARLWDDTAQNGPPKNNEKFKPLKGSDGIYEFKTSKLRMLCFKDEGSYIICTHGFVKKSQKTPKKEIATAERLKKDYFYAKEKGHLTHE
jgi:phage-related protein